MVLLNRYRTAGAAAGKRAGMKSDFVEPRSNPVFGCSRGQWDSNMVPMSALVGAMETKRAIKVGERDGEFHILMA
jgi:hypothetical protein